MRLRAIGKKGTDVESFDGVVPRKGRRVRAHLIHDFKCGRDIVTQVGHHCQFLLCDLNKLFAVGTRGVQRVQKPCLKATIESMILVTIVCNA